ncbi:hypothetical protein WJX84_004438 [Apatococcus fuscideae]|uniref:Uncharacterized protein n=1 Tax=Apatococcus fuscideae TaxID=2026836 RepID=A0AAW1SI78_9CHLO
MFTSSALAPPAVAAAPAGAHSAPGVLRQGPQGLAASNLPLRLQQDPGRQASILDKAYAQQAKYRRTPSPALLESVVKI